MLPPIKMLACRKEDWADPLQMTCLFWFESVEVIRAAKNGQAGSSPVAIPALTPLAHPDPGFKKWVASILSTTQVTQNVIVLALLFIYRLKMINPQVRGRSGSEYRLLTVALMLGNKCMFALARNLFGVR
jgi:hypothetical protein